MSKTSIEVVESELRYTNRTLEELQREIDDLKAWKRSCTIWAAGWAGTCAAVMTVVAILVGYWDKLHIIVEKLR